MLTAHQRMVRAALPWLRQSDAARIVNIASTEGLGATPGDTPYVAAKTGVTGLTRGLAVDLGKEGITVNCICPGPIRTGMTDAVPEADKAVVARRRTRSGERRVRKVGVRTGKLWRARIHRHKKNNKKKK